MVPPHAQKRDGHRGLQASLDRGGERAFGMDWGRKMVETSHHFVAANGKQGKIKHGRAIMQGGRACRGMKQCVSVSWQVQRHKSV